jgi:hypothetical protein
MDQDQASAIVVATIVLVVIFTCWVRHLREQSRRARLYDLQDAVVV